MRVDRWFAFVDLSGFTSFGDEFGDEESVRVLTVFRAGVREVATEFGVRKAQLYAKLKDADKAVAEFEGLIARNPDEGRYYTTAAEEMLRLRNGERAAYFAEKGLEKARATGNRDLEGHCQELLAAARRAR